MKQITASLVLLLLLVAPAFGQESRVIPSPVEPFRARQEIRQNVRQEIRDAREEMKQGIQEARQGLREELETKRAELKEQIQARQQEFRANVEAKRQELKQKAEAHQQELKQKLQKIKDERKKQIVERLDAKIHELNQHRLDHFTNVLERIESVLEKIVSRTDKAEAGGKNVAAVRIAIENVKTAIAAARSAIAAQAGKTYSITVSSETNLKTDVGSVRQQLVNDLKAVQDKVQAARQALVTAAQALAQVPRVDEETTDSQSPQPSSGVTP